MGNRAVIKFDFLKNEEFQPQIYLHWNGGRASVQAFLNVAKNLKLQEKTAEKAFIEFCNIIRNFGVDYEIEFNAESYGDNGIYTIDNNFNIIQRQDLVGLEEKNEEKTKKITEDLLKLYKLININN